MYNDKWHFFKNLPGKAALSNEEVSYWLGILNKVLKVGLEFEFNLEDPKGICKGFSESCPCEHMTSDNTCWKQCLNSNACKAIFKDQFESICSSHLCVNFKSRCLDCMDFKISCVKCPHLTDPNSDPENIREILRQELKPSRSYGNLSETGVHSVTTDGSLLGGEDKKKGVEIITVGRRMNYWEFFTMLQTIIKNSLAKGAYVNERCSTHVHILTGYFDAQEDNSKIRGLNELEKPMPQIILANFHQLCRRYQNALTWMSMGLDNRDHLTRWEKYRVSVLGVSPVYQSMSNIISVLEDISYKARGKYAWVNYMYTRFTKRLEDVERFHVEMRVLDGMMSPSVVTAMCCLFYALVIKAVEISKYGLLEIGEQDWYDQTMRIKENLLNNAPKEFSDDRFSHTRYLSEANMDVLRVESFDLINQVKHILLRLGPAFEVLEKLAEKPVAFYRCDGRTWEEIENIFAVYREPETIVEHKIQELIDFRAIVKQTSEQEWIEKAADVVVKEGLGTKEQVLEIITRHQNDGMCLWSRSLGTMLKL